MGEPPSNTIEPDQDFAPDERLYRRLAFDDLIQDHRIDPISIRVTDCSFNRSKYSSLGAVIVAGNPRENGAASVRVDEIPVELYCDNSKKIIDVSIAHDPEPANYAHTEIRMTRRGETWERGKRMSATIRKKMQELLSDKLRIEILPTQISE